MPQFPERRIADHASKWRNANSAGKQVRRTVRIIVQGAAAYKLACRLRAVHRREWRRRWHAAQIESTRGSGHQSMGSRRRRDGARRGV